MPNGGSLVRQVTMRKQMTDHRFRCAMVLCKAASFLYWGWETLELIPSDLCTLPALIVTSGTNWKWKLKLGRRYIFTSQHPDYQPGQVEWLYTFPPSDWWRTWTSSTTRKIPVCILWVLVLVNREDRLIVLLQMPSENIDICLNASRLLKHFLLCLVLNIRNHTNTEHYLMI
jgi:hypothetical protein